MIKTLEKLKDDAKIINDDDFNKIFDDTWNGTKKDFYKLETSQVYACDMDSNYQDYLNGNYNNLTNIFKNFYQDWGLMLKKSNIKMKRLHLIDVPLSDYLNYEMYFYLINENAGEKIRCLSFDKIKERKMDDFIIFDKDKIIINEHNINGELVKSYYSENKYLINILLCEFKILYKKGKDYKTYANFNSDVLKLMEGIYE